MFAFRTPDFKIPSAKSENNDVAVEDDFDATELGRGRLVVAALEAGAID